jgi:nucleotide-binding universal stress UspA family protein
MHDSTTTQFPIVVGIDGSQAAVRAAEWGVDEAVSREVPLRLVEVITQRAEPAPLASVGNVRMEVEYAQAALRTAAAAVAADGKLVKVETAILQGDPASLLLSRIPRRRNGVRRFDGDRTLCAGTTRFHSRRAR